MHANTHTSTHSCYTRTHMHADCSWPPRSGVWERNILATQQQFEPMITTTTLCQDVPLRTRSPMHTDTIQLVCLVRYTLTHTQKKPNQNKTQKVFLPKTSTCRDGTKLDGNNTTHAHIIPTSCAILLTEPRVCWYEVHAGFHTTSSGHATPEDKAKAVAVISSRYILHGFITIDSEVCCGWLQRV